MFLKMRKIYKIKFQEDHRHEIDIFFIYISYHYIYIKLNFWKKDLWPKNKRLAVLGERLAVLVLGFLGGVAAL